MAAERAARPEELAAAGESFPTSAPPGDAPLTGVDGFPIGAGGSGPVSWGPRAGPEEVRSGHLDRGKDGP